MTSENDVRQALSSVIDPEIGRPITDLNMVDSITIENDGTVHVTILLTVAGCPMQNTIKNDAIQALEALDGVKNVNVTMGAMNDEQREALKEKLQGPSRTIPFTLPNNLTRVIAVTSGKGGVGKSTVTANLAVTLAKKGMKVGVVDADIYGFSIPRILGVNDPATALNNMIIPPIAHGVKVISIGMFVPDNTPVVWRGPMLHRALEQFFSDVYWGDLDVLLLDLPPGTGDIALSCAQLIPKSEVLIVTTPQQAASEVAARAGQLAEQTGQRVIGVIENMSHYIMPDGSKNYLFGQGGGGIVSHELSIHLGYNVPVLGNIPIETDIREGGDSGTPLTVQDTQTPAQHVFDNIAKQLHQRSQSLVGKNLPLHT
ncbi:MAG: Mrp/NBP35 family ATP-binding protein [Actinomycetaceae bacterium]|nr:Mrp/NBP35 family ATP-binding protein [Actinomycetaceae bacterium]